MCYRNNNATNLNSKAADTAVLFYNSRNIYDTEDKCIFPMCAEGRCICLDRFQMHLLQPFLPDDAESDDAELLFSMNSRTGNKFHFSKEQECKRGFCKELITFPFGLFDFTPFGRDSYEQFLRKFEKKPLSKGFAFFLQLSVFFFLNAREELEHRDSELYMSVYGSDSENLLAGLFISVAKAVIEKKVNGESLENAKESIESVCGRLRDLERDKLSNLDVIVDDEMELFLEPLYTYEYACLSHIEDERETKRDELMAVRNFLQDGMADKGSESIVKKWINREKGAAESVLPIYCLTKAVCDAAGLDIEWPADLWLEEMLKKDQGEYLDDDVSVLIKIIDRLFKENIEDERSVVYRKIVETLNNYQPQYASFQAEDIDDVKKVAFDVFRDEKVV